MRFSRRRSSYAFYTRCERIRPESDPLTTNVSLQYIATIANLLYYTYSLRKEDIKNTLFVQLYVKVVEYIWR